MIIKINVNSYIFTTIGLDSFDCQILSGGGCPAYCNPTRLHLSNRNRHGLILGAGRVSHIHLELQLGNVYKFTKRVVGGGRDEPQNSKFKAWI